jgi:UDP-GlcNAc3NAcA epimerase
VLGKTQAIHCLSIVGARPQFIKLAPVCRAIEAHNQTSERKIEHTIVHTGQHYDHEMAELFFTQLRVPEPSYNLGVGSGSHAEQLSRVVERLEPVLIKERADWVIIYGDTNSTLGGALTAAKLGMPLAHVEAGCRSYKRSMPEEQNRVVADHLSQMLLAPSSAAVENLRREGIGSADDPLGRRLVLVGDVMYDALLANLPLAETRVANLQALDIQPGQYYLLTLHRAENTENVERLIGILKVLEDLSVPIIFPVHPRTRKALLNAEPPWKNRNIRTMTPVGYLDMLCLEKHAKQILTDSGGVQKEALYLRVPCITLREETEWPETIEVGANRLTGTDAKKIRECIHDSDRSLAAIQMPFGDGKASERVVNELIQFVRQ